MDDSSKEDEGFNASKIIWKKDRGRKTYRSKRRHEVRHDKISGALWSGASGDETRREGAG